MKDNNQITIDAGFLLNHLMWNSTRYCVGRHSYVSMYAEDYWRIIRQNREKFNESRLRFFARDIKNEIADVMRYWDNVKTENTGNDRIKYDPHFLLCRYMYNHPECEFTKTDFEIDCIAGTVTASPRPEPIEENMAMFHKIPDVDLMEWSKLASCILDSFTVEIKNGDKKESVEVIESYEQVRYDYDEPWRWERRYNAASRWTQFVPDDLIVRDHGEEKDKAD